MIILKDGGEALGIFFGASSLLNWNSGDWLEEEHWKPMFVLESVRDDNQQI